MGAAGEVYFRDMSPSIPSYSYMFMLEAMTYKVTLRLDHASDPSQCLPPEELSVEVWCNQYDKDNCDGSWHAIDLPFLGCSDDTGADRDLLLLNYGHSEIITSASDFEFTFRYKIKGETDWTWSHGWQGNGFVHVEPPRDYDKWTLGPDYDHILGALHLGNFIAATNAYECGFTHVLNLADNLDIVFEQGGSEYKKIPMVDGACNPIDDVMLKEAVDWVLAKDQPSHKILVNCRAGIGRAGSVAVGFVFAKCPQMSFDEAKDFVFQRRFVYPHRNLRESLQRIYR